MAWKSLSDAVSDIRKYDPSFTNDALGNRGRRGTWPRVRTASDTFVYFVSDTDGISGKSFDSVPYPSPEDLGYSSDNDEYKASIREAEEHTRTWKFGPSLAFKSALNASAGFEVSDDNTSYWAKVDDVNGIVLCHIPFCKRLLRVPLSVDAEIHRAYSSEGRNMRIKEIAHHLKWSPKIMQGYLRSRGLTHASHPWPEWEIESRDIDDLVEDVLIAKAEKAKQSAERIEIDRIRRDAEIGRSFRAIADHFIRLEIPVRDPVNVPLIENDFDVYFPMKDLHIGKRPVQVEASYTLAEQEQLIKESIDALIARVVRTWGTPRRWILSTGDDQLNSNSTSQATLKGTPQGQNSIGSFQDQADVLLRVKTYQIEACLSTGALVYDHYIKSNHAPDAEYLVSKYLGGFFRNEPRVTVDSSHGTFKPVTVGRTPILDLHGHGVDDAALPSLLARYAAPGTDLSYGVVFRGHTHSGKKIQQRLQEQEKVGIEIIVVPSCGPICEYEEGHGWHLARPCQSAYRIDMESGCDSWVRV